MKRILTFEALPERPGGGLLLQLALALRQLNVSPEGLFWVATPPDGTLKVRVVLAPEDRRWLPAIADHIGQLSGVRALKWETDNEPPVQEKHPTKPGGT